MVDSKTGFFDGSAMTPAATLGREIGLETFLNDVNTTGDVTGALRRASILRNSLPPVQAVELLLKSPDKAQDFADKYFNGDMTIVNRYLGLN